MCLMSDEHGWLQGPHDRWIFCISSRTRTQALSGPGPCCSSRLAAAVAIMSLLRRCALISSPTDLSNWLCNQTAFRCMSRSHAPFVADCMVRHWHMQKAGLHRCRLQPPMLLRLPLLRLRQQPVQSSPQVLSTLILGSLPLLDRAVCLDIWFQCSPRMLTHHETVAGQQPPAKHVSSVPDSMRSLA